MIWFSVGVYSILIRQKIKSAWGEDSNPIQSNHLDRRIILWNETQDVASVLLSFWNRTVADYGDSASDVHLCLLHPRQDRTTTRGRGNASPGTWPCAWLPADSFTAPCATAEPSRRRTSGSTWRASSIRPKCQSWGTVTRWRTSATAKRAVGGSADLVAPWRRSCTFICMEGL